MALVLAIIVVCAAVLLGFFWITGMLRRQPKKRRFVAQDQLRADDAQLEDVYDLGTATRSAQNVFNRPWSMRDRSRSR